MATNIKVILYILRWMEIGVRYQMKNACYDKKNTIKEINQKIEKRINNIIKCTTTGKPRIQIRERTSKRV